MFDGSEYVGRLWFADETWDDVGLPDRGALPGRTREEALTLARRLTPQDILLRYRRALAAQPRRRGLRRRTDAIPGRMRYLNAVAISKLDRVRVSESDRAGAAERPTGQPG